MWLIPQIAELRTDEVAKPAKIVVCSTSLVYGAHPLKRAIQKHVVDLIAREMISGTIGAGDHVAIAVSGDALAARRIGHAETVDA